MNPPLEAENIEVCFGTRTILDGIDLVVESGESVAIVGANGAGKTTLMKVLAGVLTPNTGRVVVGEDDLASMTRRQIARRIAVVSQGSPQVFDYSVLEFALMGNHASSAGFVASADEIEAAERALHNLELDDLASHPVSKLSGGELQRALMARAMISPASIWLLDEPTASLDVCHQVTLLECVREHVGRGNTAVAVLHDLALVHRFFDRVVVLHDSRLLADGPPDGVLTEPVVSETFGTEMKRGQIEGRTVWVVAGM